MAIWMDMTRSLVSEQYGIVGIVRAELEIAKNMKLLYKDLRISVFENNNFKEVAADDLLWLWNAESVGDAWLEHKGLLKNSNSNKPQRTESPHPALLNAYNYSSSRRVRLERAIKLGFDLLPPIIKQIAWFFAMFLYLPVRAYSAINLSIKKFITMCKTKATSANNINTAAPFTHPYQDGDTIFSCGWIDTVKERYFSKVKAEKTDVALVYLIYDIILLLEKTRYLYSNQTVNDFKEYFEWVSANCDYILYGGKTAQNDSQDWQKDHKLRIPPSAPIKFGCDIVYCQTKQSQNDLLKEYNVAEPFVLSVGSVEPRKNYSTIYKAYSILINKMGGNGDIYKLVIVGRGNQCNDLVTSIQEDPLLADKIILISPSDEVLNLLYQRCAFFLLPSLYEGWSLTLPEALGWGKFCLVSDVEPLREIGENFIEYVEPENPFAWAEKLEYYFKQPSEVCKKATFIKSQWKKTSWNECGLQILEALLSYKKQYQYQKSMVYVDITTTWNLLHQAGSQITGILRAELMMVRYLNHYIPNIKYFAYIPICGYVPIDKYFLRKILGSDSIEQAFQESKYCLNTYDDTVLEKKAPTQSAKESFWLLCSVLPKKIQNRLIGIASKYMLKLKENNAKFQSNNGGSEIGDASENIMIPETLQLPFVEGDIVFSAGTGFSKELFRIFQLQKQMIGFKTCQLIYDFTPVLIPHMHKKETVQYFNEFIHNAYKTNDLLFYGGNNAKKDGEEFAINNSLPYVKGVAVKFGTDFYQSPHQFERTQEYEKNFLKNLGITGQYIMAVGTLEMRKNHEVLYKAYIDVLNMMGSKAPQMIFVGSIGWKTGDLIQFIQNDKRIQGKLLFHNPNDESLDILYKNCEFTLLASFYEGWSLTLPESLKYNKLCLTSDVPPLREIAEGYVELIHPLDKNKWAERIVYYMENPTEIKKWENAIKKSWTVTRWDDCASFIAQEIETCLH